MKTLSIVLTATQQINFEIGGNYFHLLETTGGVDVDFLRNGAVIAKASDVESGFVMKPEGGFGGFALLSSTTQTIKIAVGRGDGDYKRTIGSVQLTGQQSAFTQGRVSLTNVNQAIIAANAARRYLMVQNNDAAQVLRLTLSGVAATAAQGFRVQPGGYLELSGFACTGAINAIMEAATATAGNCEYVSG